ncbi:MAG TPA: UDP-glucose/GDP-mannose dehydrogenase family protein [Candidatus Krumholzibacteria bacterium]|nr:UDP-glucose/GDP-mannose dehydrogenase family protein [Candidatus Krumholzibacteria bacterium]
MSKVSIIGAGYVGLVTGVCLAEKGHDVVCVESDAAKLAAIRAGRAPFHEADLPELLKKHIGHRFTATASVDEAVAATDLTLIAVGTPFDGKTIDLSFVLQACDEIGRAMARAGRYHVVVVKSTVVPGTTTGAVQTRLEAASSKSAGSGFGLGANPEFLTEGTAIKDFMHPDRIVIGGIDDRTLDALAELYMGFSGVPVIRTNPSTAEMIKYASNSLLAAMISFSNEIADLCTAVGGIDALDVMHGVHASTYLTVTNGDGKRARAPIASFLEAGCGFGGSCLPKDVSALVAHGNARGLDMGLLREVMTINRRRPGRVVEALERGLGALRGKRVAVLGLAFKPDTDDVRESPAFPIIRSLVEGGALVSAYDPVANEPAQRALAGVAVSYANSMKDAVKDADAVVVVTRWKEFEALPAVVAGMDRPPLVFDGRRMLDRAAFARYDGIGL